MIEGTLAGEDTDVGEYPDIESFVAGHGISEKYLCSIYAWDPESSDWAYCDQFKGRCPNVEEVVRMFGTGRLKWKFTFEEKDPITQRRKKPIEHEMIVKGEKWKMIHDNYRREMNAERLKKYREKLEEQRQENLIMGGMDGGGGLSPADAQEGVVKQLALLKTLMPAQGGNDALMVAMMKMQSDAAAAAQVASNQNMQLMMTMMNNSSQMMASVLSGVMNRPAPAQADPMQMFSNVATMFQKTMEIKSDMNDPGTTTLQTILEFGKEVLPAAFSMLGRIPKSLHSTVGPAVVAAPEYKAKFETLKNDPELLAAAVSEWDKVYTPEKVDELLNAANLKRPESTFENYTKYAPGGNAGATGETESAEMRAARETAASVGANATEGGA
jgi:hypothetical protein